MLKILMRTKEFKNYKRKLSKDLILFVKVKLITLKIEKEEREEI